MFGTGLGSQLFGASSAPEENTTDAPPPSDSDPEDSESDSDSDSKSSASILAAPAQTPSTSSPWLAAPAYTPPLFLSTASEYVPPAPKPKLTAEAAALQNQNELEGKSKKGEAKRAEKEKDDGKAWEGAMEGYEDSLEVDKVFERFARVAGYEGEQCIR